MTVVGRVHLVLFMYVEQTQAVDEFRVQTSQPT